MSATGAFDPYAIDDYGRTLLQRAPSASLGQSDQFNSSALVSLEQAIAIETIAVATASLSAVAAACGIYWFLVMRRNFRRDLILLLIVGDLWKSFWFGTNAAVTLALGRPEEDSKFCLASGYMLFTGIESCDWAIFFQTLHMYLQVFPPRNNSLFGYDGLYRVRRWVLVAWLVLPNLSASLAFVNTSVAYVSQGGFCTLPIRPFWYRLALSWIPRYLIWAFTLAVAFRIYSHVGLEFQVFGAVKDESSPANTGASTTTRTSRLQRTYSSQDTATLQAEKRLEASEGIAPDDTRISPIAHTAYMPPESVQASRRGSAVNWMHRPDGGGIFGSHDHVHSGGGGFPFFSRSTPSSRRGSRRTSSSATAEAYTPAPPIELDNTRASWSSKHSSKDSTPPISADLPIALTPIKEFKEALPTKSIPLTLPENSATRAIQQRRQAVQRQLRLLFIYPIAYMLLWIMPFVAHAMSYNDYYAQHPIFAIRILNIFCQCFMGFCDVSIFCWREKPWHHIPGSDGTFIGSFKCWRFSFGAQWHESRYQSRHLASHAGETDNEAQDKFGRFRDYFSRSAGDGGPAGTPGAFSNSRPDGINGRNDSHLTPHPATGAQRSKGFRGISDRRAMEVDHAHERLRMERDDWEKKLQALRDQQPAATTPSTGTAGGPAISPTGAGRKEWWDSRLMSIDDDD